jgi:hypothetical protein
MSWIQSVADVERLLAALNWDGDIRGELNPGYIFLTIFNSSNDSCDIFSIIAKTRRLLLILIFYQ